LQNLEIKAVYPNLEYAAAQAIAIGAHLEWECEQQDTYFKVAQGKLKLRQVSGHPAELIHYQRSTTSEVKTSDYLIYRTSDPDMLGRILESFLHSDTVVKKNRTLYLWHNVRIHLDRVEGLGNFIEFEAVITDNADHILSRERLEYLITIFAIDPDALQTVGYYELINSR